MMLLATSRRFKVFIALLYALLLLGACLMRPRPGAHAAVLYTYDICKDLTGTWERYINGCDGFWPNFN